MPDFTPGHARARLPVEGCRTPSIRYRTTHSRKEITQMFSRNGQQQRKRRPPGRRGRLPERQRAPCPTAPSPASTRCSGTGLPPAVTTGPRTAPRPRPSTSQRKGPGRQGLRLPRRAHVVIDQGQPDIRLRRLGLRTGRGRRPAPGRDGRSRRRERSRTHQASTAPLYGSPSTGVLHPARTLGVHQVAEDNRGRTRHGHEGRGDGRHEKRALRSFGGPLRERPLRRPGSRRTAPGPAPERMPAYRPMRNGNPAPSRRRRTAARRSSRP